MNKSRIFTASIQDTERKINRFYEKAAFGSIHFDGAGRSTAVTSALGILEEAQGRCLDYFMQTDEVRQACDYLAGHSEKARPLIDRFWKGLAINEQHIRFEATSQALRSIRQQFGE